MSTDTAKTIYILDNIQVAYSDRVGIQKSLYTEDQKGNSVNLLDNNVSKVVSYWYDESTGLLHLNARFYDPQTGRLISRDTYRGERDKASTWHLHILFAPQTCGASPGWVGI